jgi:signal transduction histidine kinase
MKRYLTYRWILLALGMVTLVTLTGMNVYNLVSLERTTVEANRDGQRTKVLEFTSSVFNRFSPAVRIFWPLNIEGMHEQWSADGTMPDEFLNVLATMSADSMYSAIYFAPGSFSSCVENGQIYKFDPSKGDLVLTSDAPKIVCDGIGLIRTRTNMLLDEYRFNTKRLFDANRTMNVAFINHRGHGIVGYVSYVINQEYMNKTYLPQELAIHFGSKAESGMSVWVYDWLRGEVVVTNAPDVEYDRRNITISQRFQDVLDTWTVAATFDETIVMAASANSLIRNLAVMGIVVLLLILSIVFIFILAQKERELAMRQAGFLANVTHELKTPIAVMQAAGENLADGRVTDPTRLKSYGDHIYTEAIRLRKMVDKLLDVAKTESGQMTLQKSKVDVASLIHQVLAAHRHLFQEVSVEPKVEVSNSLSHIMADTDSLDTILSNLIENAIKYSGPNPFLAVRAFESGKSVVIEIEDHGFGIAPTHQKLVFEKFYRVEDTLTARTKGHGLGLSIVKTMTELNGGAVTLISTPGKGSVFQLTFPAMVESQSNREPQNHLSYAH